MIDQVAQLKLAIDNNDLPAIQALMSRDPELHNAPLGYGNDGPLTWVAECRVPYEAPSEARLAIAEWMLANGSDVHQGGDGPLMRAALNGNRIPMMHLLVNHGADVNAKWHGGFPVIFAPCETLDPGALSWLLQHGANADGAALDYVIGSYMRAPENLAACIDLLLNAGAVGRYNSYPCVLAILRGRNDLLAAALDADSDVVRRQYPDLDFGTTGTRMLTLRGATLLHVAAEYGNIAALKMLLARGADVNAPAAVLDSGVGGQTALFHAATQFDDSGLATVRCLLREGADPSVRARLPGHYERIGQVVDCTPLEHARLFPGKDSLTVKLLAAQSSTKP